MAKLKVLICPYCGDTQAVGERCRACGGFFEPLSRQATHNAMGPWFVRDDAKPFQPGASYETMLKMIERGQITKNSIIRGPTSKQFWTVARRVPGLSHVLGYCHNCDASVDAGDHGCHACGVPFGAYLDRNFMGLPDVRSMPWDADAQEVEMQLAASRLDFRRAAEPLGISSFASDEELQSAGVAPITVPPAPIAASAYEPQPSFEAGAIQSSRASSIRASSAADPATFNPSVKVDLMDVGIAARSAQRKVLQQQQTIRMLMIAVFVLAGLVVIGFAAWLGARKGPAPSPAIADTQLSEAEQKTTATIPASAPESQTQPAPDHGLDATPIEVAEVSTSAETIIQIDNNYNRALELIAAAEDVGRPRPDRIADYEQALDLLKRVRSTSADNLPSDLTAIIAKTQREIERLKLEEFFP